MLEKNQSKLKTIDLHQSFKGFIPWLSGFLAGVQSEVFFFFIIVESLGKESSSHSSQEVKGPGKGQEN